LSHLWAGGGTGKARELRQLLREGHDLKTERAEARAEARRPRTLAALWPAFRKAHFEGPDKHYTESYLSQIDRWWLRLIEPALGDWLVTKITKKAVNDFLEPIYLGTWEDPHPPKKRLGRPFKPTRKMAESVRWLLWKMLKYAKVKGLVTGENPAERDQVEDLVGEERETEEVHQPSLSSYLWPRLLGLAWQPCRTLRREWQKRRC
jgi:hypothetical protein